MKNHNNLLDTQIHNPKGFSLARKRSISTKNVTSGVDWVKANYTSSVAVVCPADVVGHLHHRYFCLFSSNDATKHAVYFQITSTAVLATPTGYGGVIAINVTASGSGSTAAQVGNALQTTLHAHADFSATDDDAGVVTITGLTTASPSVDVDAGVTITVTDTEIVNEVLTTDASGNMKWVTKTVFGAETGDITGYQATTDSGSTVTVATGSIGVTFTGGLGISTSASGATVTIAETEEKKSKSDVETLLGVTTTTLGTFTGSTIADSSSIKTALQAIETKVEDTGKGYHNVSSRFSADNLDGTSDVSGANDIWIFPEVTNTKDERFFVHADSSALDYQLALRAAIETPINGITQTLTGGSIITSGENSIAYKITVWKTGLSSGDANCPCTLMGTFAITGSANADPDQLNISLSGVSGAVTMATGEGVMIAIEDIETQADMDVKGVVTLRFADTW